MKKIFTKSLAILLIMFLLAPSARADFDWPSPESTAKKMMEAIMGMFGLDQDEAEYAVQTFNESRQKKQAPQVSLVFEPTNPAPGEKITATAQPIYFLNDSKDLYFTWYVKHNTSDIGCDHGMTTKVDPTLGVTIKCDGKGNRDLNNIDDDPKDPDDHNIGIEDYKIAAARIIANDDFEWDKPNNYSTDLDKDGYQAVFGGDDQRGKRPDDENQLDKNPTCYYHDPISGNEYNIPCQHLFPKAYYLDGSNVHIEEGTDSNGHKVDLRVGEDSSANFPATQEKFWHTDSTNPDTASTGNVDESNVIGLGINKFTWNYQPGDLVGLAVEGVSTEPTQDDDSSYKTMWALPKSACSALAEDVKDVNDKFPNTDGKENETTITVTTDIKLISTDAGSAPDYLDYLRATDEEETQVVEDETGKITAGPYDLIVSNPQLSGVSTPPALDPAEGKTRITTTETTVTEKKDVTNFKTTTTTVIKTTIAVYDDILSLSDAPHDKNDRFDPALISEGPETTTDTETETTTTSTDTPMDGCLEDNFVDPTDGGSTNKIEVTLNANPTSPINDPTGEDSDLLMVQASTQNTKDPKYLKYTWEVYTSTVPNPDVWDGPLLKSELPGVKQTTGIGLDTFQMKMALKKSPRPRYLKIKATVTETTPTKVNAGARNIDRQGHGNIVVPITAATNQIHIYPTQATEDPITGNIILSNVTGEERCASGMDRAVCPVVKNEIVGLAVQGLAATNSNILWTLDGAPIQPLTYASGENCLSGECTSSATDPRFGEGTGIAYFPVLKNNGEQYSVTYTADVTDPTDPNYGTKINLTKTFAVKEPEAIITCAAGAEAGCRPEYLGSYVDLDGVNWPDYSNTSFVGVTGQPISLTPNLNMPFDQNSRWLIDGIEATSWGADVAPDGTLRFLGTKQPGETYAITFEAKYGQSPEIKKILNTSFGVRLNEFYEKMIGASVKVTMTDAYVASQTPLKHKILASLATDVPAYLAFLFRIVLTIALILFVSGLVLSFTSRPKED